MREEEVLFRMTTEETRLGLVGVGEGFLLTGTFLMSSSFTVHESFRGCEVPLLLYNPNLHQALCKSCICCRKAIKMTKLIKNKFSVVRVKQTW